MAEIILTKICTKCGIEKELSEFNNKKFRNGKIGKHAECKPCLRLRNKAYIERTGYDAAANSRKYYRENKDEITVKNIERRRRNWPVYYQKVKEKQSQNREEYLERKRISYQKNKHKYRDRMLEYSRLHPNSTTTARRRAAIKKAPGNFTKKQWMGKLEYWGYRCYLCGKPDSKLEADHRISVAKGGANWISNIAPACVPCNREKGYRSEKEFKALLRYK